VDLEAEFCVMLNRIKDHKSRTILSVVALFTLDWIVSSTASTPYS
jgi:hypothetical protein